MADASKYIRPATIQDCFCIAAGMRQCDRDEIAALSARDPLDVLLDGLETSDICVALISPLSGLPFAILGVTDLVQHGITTGAIWMLASTEIEKCSIAFLRRCHEPLNTLQKRWPVLWNCADARNELHLKWLRWLGFTFVSRHPFYGAEQREFIEFVRIERV